MKVISFFSYKGGAGRSTLAFNTIPILINEHIHPTKEQPMIVIDMDIDSCGMSYLLRAEDKATTTNSIQNLLGKGCDNTRYQSINEHPNFKNLVPVGNAYGYPDNDAVLLMPAFDGMKIDANAQYNYQDDGTNPYASSLQNFLRLCRYYKIPAVIFDSAVGNNATANVSNQLADIIVCCMRPTIQFVNGTFRFLSGLESGDSNVKDDTHIILVPNVIPNTKLVISGRNYPDAALSLIIDDFIPTFKDNSHFIYHFDMLDIGEFGIPMVDRFMWCESILYNQKEPLNENEQTVLSRYKKLANIISDI